MRVLKKFFGGPYFPYGLEKNLFEQTILDWGGRQMTSFKIVLIDIHYFLVLNIFWELVIKLDRKFQLKFVAKQGDRGHPYFCKISCLLRIKVQFAIPVVPFLETLLNKNRQ